MRHTWCTLRVKQHRSVAETSCNVCDMAKDMLTSGLEYQMMVTECILGRIAFEMLILRQHYVRNANMTSVEYDLGIILMWFMNLWPCISLSGADSHRNM